MTNKLAIIFGSVILLLLAADLLFNQGIATIFLGRRFLDLLHWVEFWR
ncbi:hypothetical protein BVG79_01726 [Ketogulonicigenium robustum]|uniref:Glyceraldehyde-3-phosphate dehydrogenase n=1 Tax=Ketogulonicigenium robustum TaxID=92947 RepID=A0A1W6P171_9RHOB|nr:hypothetical protein [Ketogulonicigenium robustum]ARO15070.1 hypothetical protein BVG79_01726 [Ketogulonicigenium robustum]